MGVIKSGFDILFIISAADGESTPEEVQSAMDYLQEQFDESFDIDAEINRLTSLDSGQKVQSVFEEAAKDLNENLTMEGKLQMLDYVVAMIFADEKVHENETALFRGLAATWGIDPDSYLADRFGVEEG